MPVCHQWLDDDPPSFTMPIACGTLQDDIGSGLDVASVKAIVMDILSGLEGLHEIGITHRDLKPLNVLKIVRDGGFGYVISDFGLISIKDTQLSVLTSTGMQMGSDYYTAPEIVADLRNASPQSDIYSVGCILHDFFGSKIRIPCHEIKEDGPFSDIMRVCTRLDPKRRFKNVSDLREALYSVTVDGPLASEQKASDYLSLLRGESPISDAEWICLVSYIEDKYGGNDASLLLFNISINKLRELAGSNPELAIRLAETYCDWVKKTSYDFSDCDSIANRLNEFYALGDVYVCSEVILAMLSMGTRHNRWYVERKFMSLCSPDMLEAVAKRVALEIKVIGKGVCTEISHLERSISVSRDELHPTVKEAIEKVCGNA